METILSVHDLCIQYEMQDGIVKALNGVDFELEEGSSHGLVGETGAGKTTMAKGIMGLTPKPYGKIKSGEILYHGKDLLKMSTKELRKIRGEHISMIFQDPMTSLNPVITVGDQIAEAVETHQKMQPEAGRATGQRNPGTGRDCTGAGNRLSPSIFRWHEAAGGHRHRPGLQSEGADCG